jgi:predicted phosphoribosyltransferase
VPVAAEVAGRLEAELDVVVARKLGAPATLELAIGAVAADGAYFLNEKLVADLRIPPAYLEAVTEAEAAAARSRETRFRAGRRPPRVTGRTVIVVDDGLATGATLRAAVRSVRKRGPARLVAAVPVGLAEACADLGREVDELVCPYQPEEFWAMGEFYEHFEPVPDDEVELLLGTSGARTAVEAGGREVR